MHSYINMICCNVKKKNLNMYMDPIINYGESVVKK